MNPVHPVKPDRKANLAVVAKDISPPANLARNAHLDLQDPKDPPDHQAKEVRKVNPVAMDHQARMEAPDPRDQLDRPETQEPTASRERKAHQAKTQLSAPKVNAAQLEDQVRMDHPDRKDQPAQKVNQDQQDQQAHRAQVEKMAVQARRDHQANQAHLAPQAKTPNIARAHVETIKHHFINDNNQHINELLQFKMYFDIHLFAIVFLLQIN